LAANILGFSPYYSNVKYLYRFYSIFEDAFSFRSHLTVVGDTDIPHSVSLQIVREISKARPMGVALDKLVMQNRRIRFDEVQTEGMLRSWELIS
jgi:hypothetical protein